MLWTPTKTKKYGVAVYNWNGDVRFGLPLDIGDTVQILEECQGWFRGFATKNRTIKGIFPSSYIHIKPCKVENEVTYETVVPLEDPVVRETTLVLREWNGIWKNLYVERETYKFQTVRKVMRDLVDWRRQLLTGTLTQDQMRELKLKITAKIDWGNRKLGLDLVPRCGAEMVDPSAMSIVQLYQVHMQSSENSSGISARGTMRKKESSKILTHHLYLCMRDYGQHMFEDTEIYFSLYDSVKNKYISERFLVRISKEGFANYVEKLSSNCTIFTDLGNGDLTKNVYVIAHILRIGKMIYSESNKKGSISAQSANFSFKRPHGVAVLNIEEMLTSAGEEKEFMFKVYQGEDKDFHQLHDFIIKKQNNKFSQISSHYGIALSMRILHGELNKVREENPLLFKSISLTRKLGFSDVIMPGDVRNDLYMTLEKGEFERGGKTTGKNIEVNVLVLDNDGKLLQECLWGASGMEGSSDYQSMIVYHHNAPCWAETIRLTVPIDKYATAHVRLEYKHCSTRDKPDNKKLFGFSFARLMEPSGATLQDGMHDMLVYRCGETAKLHPDQYLSLPATTRDLADNSSTSTVYTRSNKESVIIRTLLCSTKLTQNVDLLSLLQWKTHPERIKVALERVLILNGEELVKFLQDVLDALFSIFSTEDGNSNDHSGPVFHVLVSILSLLDDPKFEHFKPVMDAYIEGHFAAALVYKGLLTSVKHCATWVRATHEQEAIQKCFRSLEYMFKFIIESRFLFARAMGNQFEDSFKRDLLGVMAALNGMLVRTYDVILPTQIALLHSISAVYDQLTRVLALTDVAKLASEMLDSLPTRTSELPAQLTQAKLVAIRNLVTSQLFKQDDEARYQLLKVCCKHLRMHLAHRDELRLCSEILSEILSYIFQQQRLEQVNGKVNNSLHLDLEILCRDTLDMLIQTVLIIIDRSPPVLGGLVACLIGLLQLLDEYHYKKVWEELRERKPLKDFLLRAFLVLRMLVRQDVFPPDWLVMKMASNHVILGALQELAHPLVLRFLDSRCHFDCQVWSDYFNLTVAFLTQPSLQLEKFSEVKRGKIVTKYGDMRVQMGFQILSVWSQLGEHKINFIPSMVGPFLEVTLVPEPELRKATLHIFFDMMDCEQRVHGNFKQVESELIDKLDILISDNKGDDEYRQLFNTILLERVQKEDPAWKENGSAFITSVTRLLERLLDYRSVIQGDENRDKRMSCTVNLLNFYKNEINRKEMYLRYIYKLHALHVPADNFTEAGFTLKLYADSLQWSNRAVASDPLAQPEQPEWHRKEQLYHQIIQYFDKGKCWEQGIPLCKELAHLYEKKLFDYAKLSHILQTQAKFCDNILTLLRPEPEYFRVGFYGLSFPLFLRNKVFIYRGLEYERIEAFTQRLLTEFPSAQIMSKNSPPPHAILNSDVQYIQICNVKPLPDSGPPQDDPPLAAVPFKVARFYQVNQVSRFQLDRPIHKPPIDKENEFKSLWLERTLLVISSPLPGILRWFEVLQSSTEEVPPVQFACETVQNANSKLNQLVTTYVQDPKRNINPLSMRLQGMIDANVMGGIAKYQEAFFTPEFVRSCPTSAAHVQRLYALIVEQVDILASGLVVHGQLAPPEVQPLHRRLQERLDQLRVGIKRPMDSIVNTPLPPVPCAEQYCNTVGYNHFSAQEDDIYSKPLELSDAMDGRDSPPPAIPVRPRSTGNSSTASGGDPGMKRHQRSLSRVQAQRLSDGGETAGGMDEAPPLPPRTTPDKRNSGEVPPAPPKRIACRKDSESGDCSSLLRDSGYSENCNNLSGYEEWVLPPAVSPRAQGPPLPPPIPPKAPAHNDDSSNVPPISRGASVENYSVPRLQSNIPDPDDNS